MSEKNKRSAGSVIRGRGGYIALAMCAVIAGAVTWIMTSAPGKNAAEEQGAETPPLVQADPDPIAPVIQPEVVEVLPSPTEAEPETVSDPAELMPQVISPLDGTTVTVFSMTELMYDETMADWRTHNGVDIQAAEGDAVKTASGGIVRAVVNDELMGTTVLIEHTGGYTTQYSSLQPDPPVSVDQVVSAGDIIGYVGSTAAAEASMGPHLHFSVSRDGENIDPSEYVG